MSETPELGSVLREILLEYPTPTGSSGSTIEDYPDIQERISTKAKEAVYATVDISDDDYKVSPTMGQTSVAHIPYLPIERRDETESTQMGIYIVYLFDPIEDVLYLTLNQGATEAQRTSSRTDVRPNSVTILERHAEDYRHRVDTPAGFSAAPAELSEELQRSSKYNAGAVVTKAYEPADLEEEAQVAADLQRLLETYDSLIEDLYSTPQFESDDADLWTISPNGGKIWEHWVTNGVASIGWSDTAERIVGEDPATAADKYESLNPQAPERQVYEFVHSIEQDDIIVAGARINNIDVVFGVGRVTDPFATFDPTKDLKSNDITEDIPQDNYLGVDWTTFGAINEDGGIAVNCLKEGKRLFHQWTVHPFRARLDHLIGATCRRLFVADLIDDIDERINTIATKLGLERADQSHTDDTLTTEDNGPATVESVTAATDRSYYLTLSNPVNFLTCYREGVWGLRNTADNSLDETWRDLEEDDIVFFRSYRGPADNKEWGIIGYGVVGDTKTEKDDYLWPDEHLEKKVIYPLIYECKRTEWIGNVTKIEPYPEHLKSDAQLDEETDAILEDMIPAQEAADAMGYASLMDINMATLSSESGTILRELIERRQQERQDRIITAELETTLAATDITEGLYFPDELTERLKDEINAALQAGKHIILTGPPGTGKTEIAENVAEHLAAGSDRITGQQLTTATADWSTFDTVGGYMPDTEDPNRLEFTPGQILRRFKREGRQQNELLVIDEINRADIDKAFGQVFTVLSGQDVYLPFKSNEREITIRSADTYQGHVQPHEFIVPNAWRILATMNVFDKSSLYEMSYAFMRRFTFIRVGVPNLSDPDDRLDLLTTYTGPDVWDLDVDEETLESVGAIWQTVNDAGRPIGPALIRDLIAHLEHRSSIDETQYTQAVINYLLPQLEGLGDRADIVKALGSLDVIDQSQLYEAANELLRTDLAVNGDSDAD